MSAAFQRSTLVLTGVTGGLGSELLPYLLQSYPRSKIVVLLRAGSQKEGEFRLKSVQNFVGISDDMSARVQVICAQISQPKLGLSAAAYSALAAETGVVFHLAANIDFQAEYAVSRAANVDSTREIIEFCRSAQGARLIHVSTAYVSGDRQGLLRESELNLHQRFWNVYEQTKCEAEELLAQAASTLPITIFRPSQIIGDSRTGRIGKLFGYYEFAKLYLSGRMRWLIAEPAMRSDLVPVDYVCRAMIYLSQLSQSIGQTYHVVAGVKKSLSIQAICDLMYHFDQSRNGNSDPVKIVTPTEAEHHLEQDRRYRNSSVYILMKSYEVYLKQERDFDVSRTHPLLEAGGVPLPNIETALEITTKRLALGAQTMSHTLEHVS